MSWRGFYLRMFWLGAVLAPWVGSAQTRGAAQLAVGSDASGNAQTIEAALHQMSSRAAVIFVGTVATVQHKQEGSAGSGVVEIRFTVEQPIRGCSGDTYTLREWAGLWSANDSRYHVGQRLLLLLHAPGPTGLSSPVSGMDGAIPLRASGAGVRSSDTSTGASEPVADLRWVGAKLARTVIYRSSAASSAAVTPTALAPHAATAAGLASRTIHTLADAPSETTSEASTPAQEASVSTVVGMIRSWEMNDATR